MAEEFFAEFRGMEDGEIAVGDGVEITGGRR
jgi:hypothetical protein